MDHEGTGENEDDARAFLLMLEAAACWSEAREERRRLANIPGVGAARLSAAREDETTMLRTYYAAFKEAVREASGWPR